MKTVSGNHVSALRRIILGLFAVALLHGCGLRAMDAQQVLLEPVLTVAPSDLGKGTLVVLSVMDERDTKTIGYRGWAFGDAAEITTLQDVTRVVDDQVRQGLARQGFELVDGGLADPAVLEVEIRLIEYNVSQGWNFILHTRATLKAVAGKGGQVFERLYRIENEKEVMIVPPDETNEEIINGTLSDAINALVNDRELLLFLAS